MGYTLDVTGDELNKIVNTAYHPPTEDVNDNAYTTGSRQAINASTEYDFENNGLAYSYENFPSHITKLWNVSTSKIEFGEQLNKPIYVINIQLNFDPTVSSAGIFTFKAFADDGTPTPLPSISVPYKAVAGRVSAIFTIYLDTLVKDNGLIFKYESTGAGEVYDRSVLIYRT